MTGTTRCICVLYVGTYLPKLFWTLISKIILYPTLGDATLLKFMKVSIKENVIHEKNYN